MEFKLEKWLKEQSSQQRNADIIKNAAAELVDGKITAKDFEQIVDDLLGVM